VSGSQNFLCLDDLRIWRDSKADSTTAIVHY